MYILVNYIICLGIILGSMTIYIFTRSLPFRVDYIQGKIQNHRECDLLRLRRFPMTEF